MLGHAESCCRVVHNEILLSFITFCVGYLLAAVLRELNRKPGR